jgi:hypothetical protein
MRTRYSQNQRPPASWGYEDGPWQGPGPPLLGAADLVIELALNLG